MLLLLPFVSSLLLLPAGRCVRLPASSKIARSSGFRARNSSPNGPARQVAANAGQATQVGLASPKVAARAGKVGALLDSGRTVEGGEWSNDCSLTPLEGAIIGQNVEVVKALLEAGASLEAEEGICCSPLKTAIIHGVNVDVVKALLEAGASLEAEPPGRMGSSTPLGSAVRQGKYANVEVIQALIDAGASLEAEAPFAFSPLTNAIKGGNVEVIQMLIDAGVDAGASLDARKVFSQRSDAGASLRVFSPYAVAFSRTPLESAIRRGNVDVIKVLLEASLNANPLGVAFALIWNLTFLASWVYVFFVL